MHQPFATKREEHAKKKHDAKKGWAKQLGWTTAKEKNGKNEADAVVSGGGTRRIHVGCTP